MDPLEATYETKDDIPEGFSALYTERDGKFELTNVKGMKTQGDVDRLQESLRKERSDHADSRGKLKLFDGLDAAEIRTMSDGYEELKLKAEGQGTDEEKLEALSEAKLATAMAPVNRELETLRATGVESAERIVGYERADVRRTVVDEVRAAAVEAKIVDTAMEDVLILSERVFEVRDDGSVVTKEKTGVTPGIEAAIWLTEMQTKRPHWWPAATGGGGTGADGVKGFKNNPFSFDHWNMTAQGALVRSDKPKAEQMAKAAGITIGMPRPLDPNAKK